MNTDPGAEVIVRLRLFSWLAAVGGFIVLVLIAIFMTVVLILAMRVQEAAGRVEEQAKQSHNALCAVEANATKQIRQTTEFIAKHPDGLVSEGVILISREELDDSLERQRDFIDALRDHIFCQEETE